MKKPLSPTFVSSWILEFPQNRAMSPVRIYMVSTLHADEHLSMVQSVGAREFDDCCYQKSGTWSNRGIPRGRLVYLFQLDLLIQWLDGRKHMDPHGVKQGPVKT